MKYMGRHEIFHELHVVIDGDWKIVVRRTNGVERDDALGEPPDGFVIVRQIGRKQWEPAPQGLRLEIIMTAWPMVEE